MMVFENNYVADGHKKQKQGRNIFLHDFLLE